MVNIVVICPWCEQYVLIEQLNCFVFRHGYYKNTFQQIPPHMTKEDIDNLRDRDLILGCAMPFKVSLIDNEYIAEKCDYI